jgi:hypothetical protein
MPFVDKNTAIKNLANPKDFEIFKQRFLKTYKNGVEEIVRLYNNQEMDDLYNYISKINNISLNIGSSILYNDTLEILEKIKRGELSPQILDDLYQTLRYVYDELSNL